MLESDAKTKMCPFKMMGSWMPGSRDSELGMWCEGSACMAWEEWREVVRDKDGKPFYPSTYAPKDPPEGDCGMKPPELNCGYG